MERDPLMLNQRLMLMLTMDTTDMPDHMPMDTDPMDMDTHTDTEARASTGSTSRASSCVASGASSLQK